MFFLGRTGRIVGKPRSVILLIGLVAMWGRRKLPRRGADTELKRLNDELRESRDVERRRAEQLQADLEHARAEFDRTMARVNDFFWTVEILPDGEITLAFLSADASGVVGGDVREGHDAAALRDNLAHPDDVEVNAAFTAAIRAGQPAEVEERLIGYDGVTRWTWSRGTPRREGDRLFFDGITTNITERHELAEKREELLKREREHVATLEEVHRSRDDFIALAGHELRTPLTVIQGYAEYLLDDSSIDEEPRHALEIVVRRAALMSDLIDDLFDLAKLDAHVEPIEFEPVHLDELVRRSVEAQEPATRQTGIDMDVVADDVIVLGEQRRLRRMVDNVLDNAVRYSPKGGEITVTVAREGTDAVVRVADQGIGVPEVELPRVFDRLFRGSNAVDYRIPGTGLGLSSTLAIAEGHGGTAIADHDSSGGMVLTIRLPAHQSDAS